MKNTTCRSLFGLALTAAACALARGQDTPRPPLADLPAKLPAIDLRELPARNDPEYWRVANRCGLNAVYLYLSLHGRSTPYSTLEAETPIGEKGSTLADLQRIAETHGVRSAVVKATPETLPQLLPAIVHTEERSRVGGHFVVVAKYDGTDVTMIDGTTGMTSVHSAVDFNRLWTGYALVPNPDTGWPWRKTGLLVTAAATISGCVWFAARRGRSRTPVVAE